MQTDFNYFTSFAIHLLTEKLVDLFEFREHGSVVSARLSFIPKRFTFSAIVLMLCVYQLYHNHLSSNGIDMHERLGFQPMLMQYECMPNIVPWCLDAK